MIRAWLAFAAALATEAASLLLLDAGVAASSGLLAWATLHLTASLAGTTTLPYILPARLQHARRQAIVLTFLFSMGIPFFGMAGVALVLLSFARRPCSVQDGLIDLYRPTDALPASGPSCEPERRFAGPGGLVNVIKHGTDRHDRLCALIATQSLDDRFAAPILQIGVHDSDDEVRLLAYSLLVKKQKALEKRLTHVQRALDCAGTSGSLALHLAIAHHFWDMQQLSPESAAATLWLEQASRHAQAGLEIDPDNADLLMLSGMMALRARQFERADAAFQSAARAGIDAATLAPYRAECDFHRRQSAVFSASTLALPKLRDPSGDMQTNLPMTITNEAA